MVIHTSRDIEKGDIAVLNSFLFFFPNEFYVLRLVAEVVVEVPVDLPAAVLVSAEAGSSPSCFFLVCCCLGAGDDLKADLIP